MVSCTPKKDLNPPPPGGAPPQIGAKRGGKLAYFYPPPPRGARRSIVLLSRLNLIISIHAPREGSDVIIFCSYIHLVPFLSTLPARGATPRPRQSLHNRGFLSTLPARGATSPFSIKPHASTNFYPRSPRGERPSSSEMVPSSLLFLSTLPARGATERPPTIPNNPGNISIHAPREGSDPVPECFLPLFS